MAGRNTGQGARHGLLSPGLKRPNYLRHIKVFDPDVFGDQRVDVVGVGATGSRVVMNLARLGVKNIHAWDDDKIEAHNLPNQQFGVEDVGDNKAEAIRRRAKTEAMIDLVAHPEKFDGSKPLGSFVFLLTDTMSSRRQIWDTAIKMKLAVKLMVETRMGIDVGRIYALEPTNPSHIKAWEATLCDDKKAQASACGAQITVGATADVLAGIAVWQFVKWLRNKKDGEDGPENEVVYSLRPAMMTTRFFEIDTSL